MEVRTATADVERSRATLAELLLADQPARERDPKQTTTGDNELLALADRYGVTREAASRWPPAAARDISNPVIAVDHDACILCDRCVRACDDIQGNDVIGRSGKGYTTRIAFDLNDPMGESSCVTCGECVAACPTGALTNKPIGDIPIRPRSELDQVDSVCPYCGVGCALTYHVDRRAGRDRVRRGPRPAGLAEPAVRQGPVRLGLRGLAAAAHHAADPPRRVLPQGRAVARRARRDERRPGTPRRTGRTRDTGEGKGRRRRGRKPGGLVDYAEVLPHFREATWDEALDLVARRLPGSTPRAGQARSPGFGSAKCSNEEAYLFQKLIRTGFHTNNVDHCTRLCHASSVAALFEGIGSGAVSTTFGDVVNADVAIVTGSNPTANHPVASSFFKQAGRARHHDHLRRPAGRQDVRPRGHLLPDQAGHRRRVLQRRHARGDPPGADRRGVHRARARRTSRRSRRRSRTTRRERAAQITGVAADVIRRVARAWGEARAGVIFWGMGISQHTTGTDNARCLIALCAITGNVGRPGSGLHPLRGPEQRPGRLGHGADPDVLPGLPERGRPRRPRQVRAGCGAPLTWIPSAGSPSPRSSAPRSRAACAACT